MQVQWGAERRLTHEMSSRWGNKMRRLRKVEIRVRMGDPVMWRLKYGEYMEIWWVREMAIKEPGDVWCGRRNGRLECCCLPAHPLPQVEKLQMKSKVCVHQTLFLSAGSLLYHNENYFQPLQGREREKKKTLICTFNKNILRYVPGKSQMCLSDGEQKNKVAGNINIKAQPLQYCCFSWDWK